jgi:Nif-specific regulatory protein
MGAGPLKERTSLFERDLIIDTLKQCNGNLAATARAIKTTPRIMGFKAKNLGIDHRQYRRKKR